MIGIIINGMIGIGDAVQFTSVPENYFRHTNEKLVDLNSHWCLDHNPYVIRNVQKVDSEVNLWEAHVTRPPKEVSGRTVMLCNAESHARHFGYPVVMNRPRLYKYEEFPFAERTKIILHVQGRSHGDLPHQVVRHVLDKYGAAVSWVGLRHEWRYPFEPPTYIETPTMWDLARVISQCRMFIGPDSGPSWIAQCYPDVITKKVRMFPNLQALTSWVPLEWCRLGSHWDDRSAMIYNSYGVDAGFTWSYKQL